MEALGGYAPSHFTVTTLFSIEDKWELLAMHRALFTAKFASESPGEFAGSPLLAAVCERALAALQQHSISGSGESWAEWQQAERHPVELVVVRQRLAECQPWSGWSAAQRREFVCVLLSPLQGSESTVAELLAYADACHPSPAA